MCSFNKKILSGRNMTQKCQHSFFNNIKTTEVTDMLRKAENKIQIAQEVFVL